MTNLHCRAYSKSRLSITLLLVQLLVACGGGSGPTPAPSPPVVGTPNVPIPTPQLPGGPMGPYFFGNVSIGSAMYGGEALVTRDGTVRLVVSGDDVNGRGVSAQFLGRVEIRTDQLAGTGTIIGQRCAQHLANRFCGRTATGVMNVRSTTNGIVHGIEGTIQVTSDLGNETWVLSFARHDLFLNRLIAANLAGNYRELSAEFARDGDTVVSVSADGRLFFQSAGSGCTGNGALAARNDTSFNLFDVTLRIENCNPPYSHVNGEFAGLASPAADGWNYGTFLLQILLSRADTSLPPVAIAMSGRTEL